MRKILTLMSALALGSISATPVLACSNPHIDNTLNAINNGNSNYDGWQANLKIDNIKKPTGTPTQDQKPPKTQAINLDVLKTNLAQNLAQEILDKASIKKNITWFNSKLEAGTPCYNFTIDNGTLDQTKNIKNWDISADTGRITIKITYQLGTVNSDKNFILQQKIQKDFNLKCAYNQSDYKVYSVVEGKKFISIKTINKNTINVSVDAKTKPTINSIYTDFSTATQTLIQEAIADALNGNPFINSVSIIVKGIDKEKVTNTSGNLQIKVTFIVRFQDSLIDMALPSPYDDTNYNATIIQFNS